MGVAWNTILGSQFLACNYWVTLERAHAALHIETPLALKPTGTRHASASPSSA